MTKKSYFEVSPVASRWLWAGLGLVMAGALLSLWGDTFTAASCSVAGAAGRALTLLAGSVAVRSVLSVLTGAGWLLLLEHFRRGMRRAGDRTWLLVALWEVLVAVAAAVAAVPPEGGAYAYAHTPGAWDTFRSTFLVNEQVLSGCVQLLVLCACVVRYRGRILCYGLLGMICPLLGGAVVAMLFRWSTAGAQPAALLLLGGYALRLLLAWVPAVMLRRTMSTRLVVEQAGPDADVAG